ncbi:pyridoxamine-phosphate oxidase [Microbotryomycetes sp. JL221]|nr:pyridoxamine-phosphate oxidase [Microbotryomycetes sp. JL221]
MSTAASATPAEAHSMQDSSKQQPAQLASVGNHETYLSQGIPSRQALDPNPLTQFSTWFQHAQQSDTVVEPEAMSVSTVDQQTSIPSTRIVLLKQVDERGFVFYTNYESRKGRELFPQGYEPQPKQVDEPSRADDDSVQGAYCSLAFYWRPLHLSVRVVGRAETVSRQTTQEYFDGRPVGSRIGAWASKQSSELTGGRQQLEDIVKQYEKQFGVDEGTASSSGVTAGPSDPPSSSSQQSNDVKIPAPPFWGGVRIVPFEVEFWAGRPSRLHDRFRYTRPEGTDGPWKVVRLSP